MIARLPKIEFRSWQSDPPPECSLPCPRPDLRASDQRDPNESSQFDLFRTVKLHDTGIGVAAFRVVDSAVLPTVVAFPSESGHEHQADDWSLSFGRVRIVDVCFFLSFRGSRFLHRGQSCRSTSLDLRISQKLPHHFSKVPLAQAVSAATGQDCRHQN